MLTIWCQLVVLSRRLVEPSQIGLYWKKRVTGRLPLITITLLLTLPHFHPTHFLRRKEVRRMVMSCSISCLPCNDRLILSSHGPVSNLPPSSCFLWVFITATRNIMMQHCNVMITVSALTILHLAKLQFNLFKDNAPFSPFPK